MSKYQSNFADVLVREDQYLAEFICARQARFKKITLPTRFWNDPRYKREYLSQLRLVQGLLKLYTAQAISAALRAKDGQNVRSFGAKWLDPIVKREQQRLVRENQARREPKQPTIVEPIEKEGPRPAFSGIKSPLDKLRELDG